MANILLTGGNGVVGHPLRERLEHDLHTVFCVSRQPNRSDISLLQWDLCEPLDDSLMRQLFSANIDTLIHCAPIWFLTEHLENLAALGIQRIVAFSSSSVTSKQNSKDSSEHKLVEQLSDAENTLEEFCSQRNIDLTIFRPSMIYGYGRDQNVTHLAKFIKRYNCMVLVGRAEGLRQPVHSDDLVEASINVLSNPGTFGKTYHLAGGETLTYRAMIERIFVGLDKRPRIISLPLSLFRLVLKIAALLGRFSYTPEMADRMNQDLNYDNSPAQQDFSYAPQGFLSDPKRDLA